MGLSWNEEHSCANASRVTAEPFFDAGEHRRAHACFFGQCGPSMPVLFRYRLMSSRNRSISMDDMVGSHIPIPGSMGPLPAAGSMPGSGSGTVGPLAWNKTSKSTPVHGSGAFTRAAEDRSSITQTRSVRSAGMSSAYAPTLFRIGVRLSHTSRSAVVWSIPTQSPSLLTLRYRSCRGSIRRTWFSPRSRHR